MDVGKEVEEKDDERGCSTAEAENRELAHDTPGGGLPMHSIRIHLCGGLDRVRLEAPKASRNAGGKGVRHLLSSVAAYVYGRTQTSASRDCCPPRRVAAADGPPSIQPTCPRPAGDAATVRAQAVVPVHPSICPPACEAYISHTCLAG